MFERSIVKTVRGHFEVFVAGEGEPLAFTHLYSEFNTLGNLMSQQLSKLYKVIIINLRGAGSSDNATEEYSYSMDDAVLDMEAVRKVLNIEQWAFAGHSTGGFLALKYAVGFPESLTKIIAGGLCASGEYMDHPGSIYCEENPNNQRMKEIFSLLRESGTTREQRVELSKEWILMSLYRKNAYHDMLKKKESGRTLMDKIDYFTAELPEYDVRDQLKRSEVRSYIYCGLYDSQCPHLFSEEAVQLMNNATLTTFEYSSHHPYIEEEKQFESFLEKTIYG